MWLTGLEIFVIINSLISVLLALVLIMPVIYDQPFRAQLTPFGKVVAFYGLFSFTMLAAYLLRTLFMYF